jgi:cytochrome b
MGSVAKGGAAQGADRVRVWDLPTRLFHWTLVALTVFSVVTAKIGGNAIEWHFWSGYAVLSLLLFRLLWGVAGDRYARFANFVRGPRTVLAYLRGRHDGVAGHNPLGALSVLALLAAMLLQAVTGLFANDAIFSEGPLAKLVSGASSDRMTRIHSFNEWGLYGLIGLHLAAVAYHEWVRGRPTIRPMISGDRRGIQASPARDDAAIRLRAGVLLAAAASLVGYVVSL